MNKTIEVAVEQNNRINGSNDDILAIFIALNDLSPDSVFSTIVLTEDECKSAISGNLFDCNIIFNQIANQITDSKFFKYQIPDEKFCKEQSVRDADLLPLVLNLEKVKNVRVVKNIYSQYSVNITFRGIDKEITFLNTRYSTAKGASIDILQSLEVHVAKQGTRE